MFEIDLFLTDGFPALSLTLITEPLRVANREELKPIFRWRFLSETGGDLLSSSGLKIRTEKIGKSDARTCLLLTSYHPERAVGKEGLAWLRHRARMGCLMGCIDTGALIFAEAGLLNEHPAAAHFEAISAFSRQYPQEMFIDRLFDYSPPRCSSAGGVSTLDLTLALISHFRDEGLAGRVAEILTYERPEGTGRDQKLIRSLRGVNRSLGQAVELMLAHQVDPLPIRELAKICGLPDWKLRRLFMRYLHMGPREYYLGIRLGRAREMLRNSHLKIGEVAVECGFENLESFSRSYKRRYDCCPSQDRGF